MTFRKITDISKRGIRKPLVLERPVREYRNTLKVERRRPPRRTEFDLRLERRSQSGQTEADEIFLPDDQRRGFTFRKIQLAVGALVIVILLNIFGIFGAGKVTVERVITTAFSGMQDLVQAGESFAAGDFADSTERFQLANEAFLTAEADLHVFSGAGAVLSTQPGSVQSGARLVTAGRLVSAAGQRFAGAANDLAVSVRAWPEQQRYVAAGGADESFSTEFASMLRKIAEGAAELESAGATLDIIDTGSLPDGLAEKVQAGRSKINFFLGKIQPYLTVLPQLPELLGDRIPRRYLVLFQNSDEIRPTGGFIGSFAEITLNDGFVTEFRLRDIYELDGQLAAKRLPPPEGFGVLTDNWGMRDANYHPDFPTSAAAAAWLYEEGGGGTVDGIFAITSPLLTRLVEAVGGEISLSRFHQSIPADDLNPLLSLIIEAKVDGADDPKQILDEVWAVLREQLPTLPPEKILALVQSAISAKEVQFWSAEPDFQEIALVFRVDGALATVDGDYIFVSDTSLSGNKSDRYTSNQVRHATDIQSDGTVLNRLTLTRTHGWSETEERIIIQLAQDFGISLDEKLIDLLGRGRNVDLIKVFVPSGSELVSVTGIGSDRIETHVDSGRTYFSLPLTVQPGDSREVGIVYSVPGDFSDGYRLTVGYQAGTQPTQFTKTVVVAGEEIFSEETSLLTRQEFTAEW